MKFFQFVLAMQVTAQAFRDLQENEICVTGFIMDRLCIDLGTLLDNPSLETLRFPEEHSIHCLVDIPGCVESGYEVLVPGDGDLYERAVTLDSFGNQEVLRLARDSGDTSCSTCTGSGTKRKGFSATVKGFLKEGNPPLLETTAVVSDTVSCDQFLASTSSTPSPNSPQPIMSNIFASAAPVDSNVTEATGMITATAAPLGSPDAFPTTFPFNSAVNPPSSVPVTPGPVTSVPSSSPAETMVPSVDNATVWCFPFPEGGCSVCGEGMCVTNFDSILVFPGQPLTSCGVLQNAGYQGFIPLTQCADLPALIGDCECRRGNMAFSENENSPSPVPVPIQVTASSTTTVGSAAPITAAPVLEATMFETPMPVPITAAPVIAVESVATPNPSTGLDIGSIFDTFPEDDGVCQDDAKAVFFVERTGKKEPCRWLAARPGDQEELCRPSHPSRAFYICEETCKKCTDSCQDNTDFKFIIMDGEIARVRTCLWLFLRPSFQDEYCQRDDVKVACMETCQLCPTEAPTSAPCEDNPSASFVTPNDGDQGCAYLRTITVQRRLPLCDPVSGIARQDCPESCAACTDNCFDSTTETFEYEGGQQTCSWLSTNVQAQADVCYAWNIAWTACKESCNHWSCNIAKGRK